MATWGQLKAKIADDLARSDLTSQIAEAMKEAVRFYKWSDRFWLGEAVATFSTVAAQEWYTDAETGYSLLYNAGDDSIRITDGDDTWPLIKATYAEIEAWSTSASTQSRPEYYVIYRNQLRLFPIPDAVYTLTISYRQASYSTGFRTFPYSGAPLTGIDDTSPQDTAEGFWTTEASELIRARAKVDLFENTIRDFPEADRMRGREREVLHMLQAVADRRNGSGMIRAHAL